MPNANIGRDRSSHTRNDIPRNTTIYSTTEAVKGKILNPDGTVMKTVYEADRAKFGYCGREQ